MPFFENPCAVSADGTANVDVGEFSISDKDFFAMRAPVAHHDIIH